MASGERRQQRARVVGRRPGGGVRRAMTVCRGSAAPALYLSDMGEQPDESAPTARSDSVASVRKLALGRVARRRRSPAPRIDPRETGGDVTALRVGKQELRPFFTPKGLAEYLSIS